MARQTNQERLQAVHARAVKAFDVSYMPQTDVRLHCLQARRFAYIPGAQWEGSLEQQFANRPRFEINKVLDSLMRIFSEYRNNRVTVDYRTKDDLANDETADALNGLFRSDEQESNAEEAYDNAFDEGTPAALVPGVCAPSTRMNMTKMTIISAFGLNPFSTLTCPYSLMPTPSARTSRMRPSAGLSTPCRRMTSGRNGR